MGFEPTVPFNTVHSLSRRAPSATRAPLQFIGPFSHSGTSQIFAQRIHGTLLNVKLNLHDFRFFTAQQGIDLFREVVREFLQLIIGFILHVFRKIVLLL